MIIDGKSIKNIVLDELKLMYESGDITEEQYIALRRVSVDFSGLLQDEKLCESEEILLDKK